MKRVALLFVLAALACLLAVPGASAQEYTVTAGYDSPVAPGAEARVPVPVPFWSLPLWVMLAQLVLVSPELILALKLWAYMGIRRVSAGNVLGQDARARIYEHIRQNPGIHLRGLAAEMQMKIGTLRYHLNVLRLTHKIALSEDPASVRFYENNGTYSPEEQQIHKHLRNETTRKILSILLDRPSVSRQEIADAVGISGPSITWHMQRLEEDKLVVSRREGRMTAYEIPAPVAGYLSRQIRASVSLNARDAPGIAGQV
jgi:predicted transcriptional regulator